MTGTYEMTRAIPSKALDWSAFLADMRAEYITIIEAKNKVSNVAEYDALISGGMRDRRNAAYYLAAIIVDYKSKRSHFQAPIPETLAWGGFLGGEVLVWTDKDDEDAAVSDIAAKIAKYRKAA